MTYKHFIGAITALAIGITGLTAAPARASDDTAKIVTGIAALAIVGAVIADSKKDNHGYVAKSHGHKPYYYGKKRHHSQYYASRGHKKHAFKHHRKFKKKHHYKVKRHHYKKRRYGY